VSNGAIIWELRADKINGSAFSPVAWTSSYFVRAPPGWREAEPDEIIDESMRWTATYGNSWEETPQHMFGLLVSTFSSLADKISAPHGGFVFITSAPLVGWIGEEKNVNYDNWGRRSKK